MLLLAAAAAASAWVGSTVASARPATACAASVVRYQPAKHPSLGEPPWVLGRPQRPGIAVFLRSYEQSLSDGRVNGSDGLVLWQRGERVAWNLRGTVVARRLDGPGRFSVRGPSVRLAFPSVGCWSLTLRDTKIIARVVTNPATLGCDATPAPEDELVPVRPRQAGIAAGWSWRTEDGRALMYTHGLSPDGYTKVLWWIRQKGGGALSLTGIRLDAAGRFHQLFQQVGSPSGHPPGYLQPYASTVVVPHAGCWLFRLRSARLAGVLVARAVDRPPG